MVPLNANKDIMMTTITQSQFELAQERLTTFLQDKYAITNQSKGLMEYGAAFILGFDNHHQLKDALPSPNKTDIIEEVMQGKSVNRLKASDVNPDDFSGFPIPKNKKASSSSTVTGVDPSLEIGSNQTVAPEVIAFLKDKTNPFTLRDGDNGTPTNQIHPLKARAPYMDSASERIYKMVTESSATTDLLIDAKLTAGFEDIDILNWINYKFHIRREDVSKECLTALNKYFNQLIGWEVKYYPSKEAYKNLDPKWTQDGFIFKREVIAFAMKMMEIGSLPRGSFLILQDDSRECIERIDAENPVFPSVDS